MRHPMLIHSLPSPKMVAPKPSTLRAAAITLGGTLLITLLTGGAKAAFDSKVSVSRYEVDSVDKFHKMNSMAERVARTDSTTQLTLQIVRELRQGQR